MPSSAQTYELPSAAPSLSVNAEQFEYGLIGKGRCQAETALMAGLVPL